MDALDHWAARHGVSAFALAELKLLNTSVTENVETGASEARVQSQIRLAAPKLGYSLWRNNSGAYSDDNGRVIRYGLANDSKQFNAVFKSSDLIGIGPHGRFVAVEVKKPGWTKPSNAREIAQSNFLGDVNKRGGIGMFATSAEQYEMVMKNAG